MHAARLCGPERTPAHFGGKDTTEDKTRGRARLHAQFFKLFNIQIIMMKRLIVLTFSLILLSLSILLFHLQKDLIIICFVVIITLIRILILYSVLLNLFLTYP